MNKGFRICAIVAFVSVVVMAIASPISMRVFAPGVGSKAWWFVGGDDLLVAVRSSNGRARVGGVAAAVMHLSLICGAVFAFLPARKKAPQVVFAPAVPPGIMN
jgi:hypothetical protein